MTADYRIERYVLRCAAVATLVIGLVLLLFSSELVRWFGSSVDPNRHFAIYLGAALIGFSIVNWLYSRSHDLAVILPVLYGNLASLAIAAIVDVIYLIFSPVTKVVWLILLLHLVFTGAFTYCVVTVRRS